MTHYRAVGDRRRGRSHPRNAGHRGDGDRPADRAVLHFEELLAIAREVGHARGVAATLVHLGRVATKQGAYDRARSLLEEAVALNRAHDDHLILAWSLLELGELERVQGHADAATACPTGERTLYQETKGRSRASSRACSGWPRWQMPRGTRSGLSACWGRLRPSAPRFLAVSSMTTGSTQAQILERARARLGAERFTAAWERGFASSLAEAIAAAASPAARGGSSGRPGAPRAHRLDGAGAGGLAAAGAGLVGQGDRRLPRHRPPHGLQPCRHHPRQARRALACSRCRHRRARPPRLTQARFRHQPRPTPGKIHPPESGPLRKLLRRPAAGRSMLKPGLGPDASGLSRIVGVPRAPVPGGVPS